MGERGGGVSGKGSGWRDGWALAWRVCGGPMAAEQFTPAAGQNQVLTNSYLRLQLGSELAAVEKVEEEQEDPSDEA